MNQAFLRRLVVACRRLTSRGWGATARERQWQSAHCRPTTPPERSACGAWCRVRRWDVIASRNTRRRSFKLTREKAVVLVGNAKQLLKLGNSGAQERQLRSIGNGAKLPRPSGLKSCHHGLGRADALSDGALHSVQRRLHGFESNANGIGVQSPANVSLPTQLQVQQSHAQVTR